jgi:hypothetical protein
VVSVCVRVGHGVRQRAREMPRCRARGQHWQQPEGDVAPRTHARTHPLGTDCRWDPLS